MIPLYQTQSKLGVIFGMSRGTVSKYIHEMLSLSRYKNYAPVLTLEQDRFSVLCFFDYLQNRTRLRDKNMSRFVSDYDPAQAARLLGEEYEKRGNT